MVEHVPRPDGTAHRRDNCFARRTAIAVLAVLLGTGLLLFPGCGTEPPANWQWWTSEDSAAVQGQIAPWRGTLDARNALADTFRVDRNFPLASADTLSTDGAPVYKFAHLLAMWVESPAEGHLDEYHFGVTVDTVAMTDTFCEVWYRDTLAAGRVHFLYDSLWVVTFQPDTQPDSTVRWRVATAEKVGYEAPQDTAKVFDWQSRRIVFLPKTDSGFRVTKLTGFASFVPSSQDAPGVSRVVLTRPGVTDTFFYTPRPDGRAIYNLKPLASLYTVRVGEQVTLDVAARTPSDTGQDKNRFYVTVEGRRNDFTLNALNGRGTLSFATPGYNHIYVELVPNSNILYKHSPYASTIWAIPVMVEAQ
jgi:hypothetical protein